MELKYAVYPGTITLDDGTEVYVSAAELADYYGLDPSDEYVVVEQGQPSPFTTGSDEATHVQLIPRSDGKYPNIKEVYNASGEEYWGEDFDARKGGKWAERPKYPDAP